MRSTALSVFLLSLVLLVVVMSYLPKVFATPLGPYFVASTGSSDAGWGPAYGSRYSAYVNGRYWIFYLNSSSVCKGISGCMFVSSSIDATTWRTPTNLGIGGSGRTWAATFFSTTVYITWYNGTTSMPNNPLFFRSGTLNSDGTVSWSGATVDKQVLSSGGSGIIYRNEQIVLNSNNWIFIAYIWNNITASQTLTSSFNPYAVRSNGTNYSVWQENTLLPLSGSAVSWVVGISAQTSGKVYAVFGSSSSNPLNGRQWNNGWGGTEQVASVGSSQRFNVLSDGSTDNVYVIWQQTTPANGYLIEYVQRTTSWSSNETIVNAETAETTSGATQARWAVSYDVLNSKFHLFYYNDTNKVIWEVVGSKGSWGAKANIFTTFGGTIVSQGVTIVSFAFNSGQNIGLMWSDTSNSGASYRVEFGVETVSLPSSGSSGSGGSGGSVGLTTIKTVPIQDFQVYLPTAVVYSTQVVNLTFVGLSLSTYKVQSIKIQDSDYNFSQWIQISNFPTQISIASLNATILFTVPLHLQLGIYHVPVVATLSVIGGTIIGQGNFTLAYGAQTERGYLTLYFAVADFVTSNYLAIALLALIGGGFFFTRRKR